MSTKFRDLANADPTLFGKLYSQPHPIQLDDA